MRTYLLRALLFASLLLLAFPSVAQLKDPPPPEPVPYAAPIAAPVDKPYAGPITLDVDMTNVTDRVVHVHEQMPVEHGAKELVLLYPQWIPGTHSPTGPISRVAGVVTQVDGHRVQWIRDQVNVYAFHVPLPAGAKSVEVDFDYLSPLRSSEGRVEMSAVLADLPWVNVAMYPAGHFIRRILVDATIKLPAGWKYATALETASEEGSTVKLKPTPLNEFFDSPLYAGAHFKRLDLSTGPNNPVYLDVFADEESDLAITPDELQKHRQLAIEAAKVFGSHHYKHYDFLLTLSNKIGGEGLEHHQSSEDGTRRNYFTEWNGGGPVSDLLGHEYTHSWNGKFRRPAALWTPNLNVPMRDDLLWVYEGMTQYWGMVLTTRSGMRTAEDERYVLARIAAGFEVSPGRTWRPLVDTTNQPTVSQRRPVSFVSWQLPENYYTEGALIWLDADTKIRELTNGQKSLDDVARNFFGVYNGSYVTYTYTLDDLVKAFNEVAPYDWAGFFRERVYDLHPPVPEDGITRGGYKLVYTDTMPAWLPKAEGASGNADFSTSLGFSVSVPRTGPDMESGSEMAAGMIMNVWWNSAAFKAGVTPGMRLISVNGTAFTAKVLREAILEAEKSKQPLNLQFRRGNEYVNVSFPYFEGLRVPSLQRVDGTPDRLDDILAPSKAPMPSM